MFRSLCIHIVGAFTLKAHSSALAHATFTAYLKNIRTWSVSSTPPPTNGRTNPVRSTRSKQMRGSNLASTPQVPNDQNRTQSALPIPSLVSTLPSADPRSPAIPAVPQAMHSTYASRLRTGTTLLMQPILVPASVQAVATRTSRRGGIVNYTEPGSGDEFPDAGALDSDDSDFIASGGTRMAIRSSRLSSRAPVGASVFNANVPVTPMAQPTAQHRNELDQSYLGRVPPSRFITARPVALTKHEYL